MTWGEFGSLLLFLGSVYAVFFIWIPKIDAKKQAAKLAALKRPGDSDKPLK